VRLYDAQDSLLQSTKNTYTVRSSSLYYGAKILPYRTNYAWVELSGSLQLYTEPQNVIGYYPIFDCETLVRSDTTIVYANNTYLTTTTLNTYDSMFNQLVYSSHTGSGYVDEMQYYYPYNNPYDSVLVHMYLANRLSDVVGFSKYRDNISGTSLHAISSFSKTYEQLNYGFQESFVNIVEHVHPYNNLPTEIYYDHYDSSSNLLQFTTKKITNSFVWDYNSQYVIAEVKNAPVSLIAYTSFEADGKGNWTFSGAPSSDISSPTGKKVYALTSGNITKSLLDSTKTYTVSYWSKNGQQTVNGMGSITGRNLGNWTYYEHTITNPPGGSITVSGSGTIDELRLYPKGALMITYTYAPLIGMTSQCDQNNRISYYEYDSVGRLGLIRDQDKNIVKQICYNYAGQTENCHVATVYVNSVTSQNFIKNSGCFSGQIGTSVTYTVPQGIYSSAISQHVADSLALVDISTNGQSYANAHGGCVCDTTVCNGSDPSYKCINLNCEHGTAVCVSSVFANSQWTCTWYYRFSDCTQVFAYVTHPAFSGCTVAHLCR
jgi:hypothetical protein